MKIVKKDYPFTIIIEDKVGKNSGKPYQSISVIHTSIKNKEAKDPKEKYESVYFNFFDERDLLKLSSLAENTYIELKNARGLEKSEKKETPQENNSATSSEELDDDLPF